MYSYISTLLTNHVQDVDVKFVAESLESNKLSRDGLPGAESRKRLRWDINVECKAYSIYFRPGEVDLYHCLRSKELAGRG